MNLSLTGFVDIALVFAIIKLSPEAAGPTLQEEEMSRIAVAILFLAVRDDQGQVAKMLIRISGQQMEAKRIK